MEKLISVIVPMYYEEEVISHTYVRLTDVLSKIKYAYEIIFVDDGSKDNTYNIIKDIADKDKNVKCLKLSRNFGHQSAVTAGLFYAKGDAIVIIDADLQDPPEVIPKMIEKWEDGVMVCYGVREKRQGETKFKLLSAKLFYTVLDRLSDVAIPKDTGDFRLIDKKVLEQFKNMPEHNRFIRGMISFVGFRQEPLYYIRDERFAGETKYPLKKMIRFAFNGIVSFSAKPLKSIYYISMIPLFVSIIFFVISIVKMQMLQFYLGLFSFFFFLCVFSVAIVAQYISRIYDEAKGRQLYIIEETLNL